MDWIRTLLSRCAEFFRRRDLDADLDEELGAHIDLAIAENMKSGMPHDAARTAALRAFGGVAQTRETYRVQRGFPWLEHSARDARFAFRALRKSPGFTLTAVLTLALGIGAVTSVFSVVEAVLLKPFAFRDPQRLVVLREAVEDETSRSAIPNNYRHVLRLKNTATTLEDVAIFGQHGSSVSPDGEHPRVMGTIMATPNLFALLGVQPVLGRGFVESDADKTSNSVVMLSYSGWQSLFAGRSQSDRTSFAGERPPADHHRCIAAGNALSADRPLAHDRVSGQRARRRALCADDALGTRPEGRHGQFQLQGDCPSQAGRVSVAGQCRT